MWGMLENVNNIQTYSENKNGGQAYKQIGEILPDLISKNPYKYTSDEILFQVHAKKNNIAVEDLDSEREKFFSKGQPSFRSSPLTKRYGWGVLVIVKVELL